MHSRWAELKFTARQLRYNGRSIRQIEAELGIPRSTLSGWLRDIQLTPEQIDFISVNKAKALMKAREKSAAWHRNQKDLRIQQAESVMRNYRTVP